MLEWLEPSPSRALPSPLGIKISPVVLILVSILPVFRKCKITANTSS
jgi:hypothetical protein